MPITQRNKIGMLEAMLFANAEPVETDRLAEAMRADPAEVLTLLEKLQKRYDETESVLMLLHFDGDRWPVLWRGGQAHFGYPPQRAAFARCAGSSGYYRL